MTSVSRSVYQKLAEENKRLMNDIKVMATGDCFDAIQMRLKWRKYFKEKEDFNRAIKEILSIKTPNCFGAKGDGITDDTAAIQFMNQSESKGNNKIKNGIIWKNIKSCDL